MSGRTAYLVRHAHAGDRSSWPGDDSRRPLSEKGWRQAHGIAELLRDAPLRRVLSSPAVRCVQTVEPLATAHGLHVEIEPSLREGADPHDTLAVLHAMAADGAVAGCTHGDVIPGVLDLLGDAGAEVEGPLTWPKASTWVLEGDERGFTRARYVPPPALG
ncbi:MAG TPA: phosphoglycerate mutase family protein [Candidatus Dormibacteraeota bacterium]|nr:phosphoglycerate mutase family protein [Candidatus Dormibacteraeota bacterium]